jgi:translation initiation factor 4A
MVSKMNSEIKNVEKWDEMGLKEDLLRGIYSYGFDNPSEIQQKAIMPIIERRDVIAQAQSGCGKTGSFTIGALQVVDVTKTTPQILVLSPTHELVKQTALVMEGIGSFMNGLCVKTLIGGTSIRDDVTFLQEKKPQVIVGSVGRVLDMIEKRHLAVEELKMMILDEADEMLSQGFSEKIRYMFQSVLPVSMQVVLFSATMPDEIVHVSRHFMNKALHILMEKEQLSLQCIQQYYVAVENDSAKYMALRDIFSVMNVSKCILYCNSVRRVNNLFDQMSSDGFSVVRIHSNMNKSERARIFRHFRTGDARILISSDVTARGIDIQQVSAVINVDLTRNVHTYLHRIGRSGRWGRRGIAINLVTKSDVRDLRNIERWYNIAIHELPSNFNGDV